MTFLAAVECCILLSLQLEWVRDGLQETAIQWMGIYPRVDSLLR